MREVSQQFCPSTAEWGVRSEERLPCLQPTPYQTRSACKRACSPLSLTDFVYVCVLADEQP